MNPHRTLFDDLEDAIARGSKEHQAATLRRVADLFVSGALRYSEEQVALFDDVLARLTATLETAVRAELAELLAPIANAPPKVIRNFAFDAAIDVARPVLTQSPRLGDDDLVAISQTMSQQHLLAVSHRETLSEAVTEVLVDRGEREVVQAVAGNQGARFSESGFSRLVQRAEGDDDIAACVGLRADLPRHLFLQLLAKASETVRTTLARTTTYQADAIQAQVASIVNRTIARSGPQSRDFKIAEETIRSLQEAGEFDERHLDRFAAAGQFEETAVAFAALCNVPVDLTERALMQERPETTLILAKAANLSWTTVKMLLVLRSQGKGVTQRELDLCLTNFERLKRTTAQQVIRLPGFGTAR